MMKKYIKISFFAFLLFTACNSKPEVIIPVQSTPTDSELDVQVQDPKTQVHEVVVKDILQSSRYTYMNVTEGGDPFWIATSKANVEKDQTVYYQGGLLMKNFESVEFNRIFETIYLVSALSEEPILMGQESINSFLAETQNTGKEEFARAEIDVASGGISLNDLFSNKAKYEGQIVRIKGQCVKVNRNIMDRNWIHLQDGSGGDQELDLTVTTSDNISVGDIIIFEGKISLDVDFGAGYRYDIIMEDAQIVL